MTEATGPSGPVHVPVCPAEVLSLLGARPGATFLDATVGEGGHAERLAEATAPDGVVVGSDRDPEVLAVAAARLARFGERVRLRQADAGTPGALAAAAAAAGRPLDGVLFDFGISSWHLGDPARGFAFDHAGPLDMRLDRTGDAPTLLDRLATVDDTALATLLWELADERHSRRIARAILRARDAGALHTTADLARVVTGAVRGRGRIHPATKTFQALRIWVNGELERIPVALADARALLRPGGRLVTIAFHSGEDRLVKTAFRDWKREGVVRLLTPKPLRASPAEVAANPRARSAAVRGAELL